MNRPGRIPKDARHVRRDFPSRDHQPGRNFPMDPGGPGALSWSRSGHHDRPSIGASTTTTTSRRD
eukprot:8305387-Pyramimonas_sp.AAC.2